MKDRDEWLKSLRVGDAVDIECSYSDRIIHATVAESFVSHLVVVTAIGAHQFIRFNGFIAAGSDFRLMPPKDSP